MYANFAKTPSPGNFAMYAMYAKFGKVDHVCQVCQVCQIWQSWADNSFLLISRYPSMGRIRFPRPLVMSIANGYRQTLIGSWLR
jgi:hypothetical protein